MAMPGFGEVGYCFVKMFCCKEGMRPFNGTVTTVLPREKYIVGWDPPDGKSETVSHAVLKRWSLTRNDPSVIMIVMTAALLAEVNAKLLLLMRTMRATTIIVVRVTTVKGWRSLITRP